MVIDLNVLYESYLKSYKTSHKKMSAQEYRVNFLFNIVKASHELESGKYQSSECSHFLLNERGKERYITGVSFPDRVVHHAICDNAIMPAIKPYLLKTNCASQKGKGTEYQREILDRQLRHYFKTHNTNVGYIALFDFSGFYDNIQHSKLIGKYRKVITDPYAMRALESTIRSYAVDVSWMSDSEYSECMNRKFKSVAAYKQHKEDSKTGKKKMEKSVPIGDQISQDSGIFFPVRFDTLISCVYGLPHGRYTDDFYAISDSKETLLRLRKDVEKLCKEEGLFLNEKKTQICRIDKSFHFLQDNYHLNETGRVVRKINRKRLHAERRRMKKYARMVTEGTLSNEEAINRFVSWHNSFKKKLSKKQLKHLRCLAYRLYGKEEVWKKLKRTSLNCRTVQKSQQA